MDTLLEVAATRSLPDRALVQETRSDYGWETRSDYECPTTPPPPPSNRAGGRPRRRGRRRAGRRALGRAEAGAMALELVLSQLLERRLGPVARPLKEGRSGRLMRLAKAAGACGLAVRAAGRRRERLRTAASALTLTSGLVLRYAWLGAGPPSAADDAMVAMVARAED